jgi:hypothetical protein
MATKWPHRPPFRVEHLGSLFRPFRLLEAKAVVDRKQATSKELSSVEDELIKQIVLDLGFHPISFWRVWRHKFWYDQILIFQYCIKESSGTFFLSLVRYVTG